MSKEKMVPEIRFNKYNLVWKSETLKNIATFSKGKGYKRSDVQDTGIPIIFYGDMYTNFENIITQVSNFVNEKPNSVKSSGGEVIIPSSGETAEDIAVASVVKDKGVILGGDLNIIKTQEELEPHYLALSLTYGKSKNELIKRAQGSSIIHLYNNDIKTSKIIYPSLEEQQKIGQLFEKLDQAISLQQQVLEATKDYKQSMLQKMFPKKGKKVPEIRFKGFNNNWSIKEIGSISKVVGGGTPSTTQIDYWNGDINWFSPSEIGDSIYISNSKRKITELGLKKSSAKLLPPKKTILFTSRATIGEMAILTIEAATNQGFQSLVPNNETDIYFLYTLQNNIKKEAVRLATGSTFLEISGKEVRKIRIPVPSSEEQQKIGSFFKTLDEKIEQEKKKLEAYESMKKALMQRMFV